MILRFFALAILLAIPALEGACAEAERIKTATIIEEVFRLGPIKSFMLQRDGELLIEAHRKGMRADRTTNVKSVAKSIISLLVGIAIGQGHLPGVQQPIGDYFPDYFKGRPDPEKQAITIQDLLTMRTGLASTSRRNYGRWVQSDNWIEFALDQPLVDQPGGEMIYSTGSTHLLSVILTRATGMSTRKFAERYLFGPLGITLGGWDRDPQGYYLGGNNMALSPSALLKIGTMVMNNGVYNQKQIVPSAWIAESMQIYTRSHFNPYDYGYLWWQRELNGYTVQFAWGNGGQYILMIPALKTVVAIVSGSGESNEKSRASRRRLFEFIENRLINYLQ
ncbi:MAG: beta-lactamase family protein [Gammaproteobacteria bacterium]|nr:beta-lactamase family protein [Gammaproteobacteria bacterium]MDH3468331.1 beta-lactamase family protein [Gammaproteobacteria bacterium]